MERSALHRKLKSLGVVTSNKAGARVAHVPEDGDEAPPHEAREAG
jgi:two-component system nitrogen regulation response regulator NtrX